MNTTSFLLQLWSLSIVAATIAGFADARGQQPNAPRFRLTYRSATALYFEGGRADGASVGDTLRIIRGDTLIVNTIISAVAEHSCAALPMSESMPAAIGDTAVLRKIEHPHPLARTPGTAGSVQTANSITGRLVLEYQGIYAEDSRLNLNRPSVLVQLTFRDLLSTGSTLVLYGRSAYDVADRYGMYNHAKGLDHRVYLFSLSHDLPEDPYGFAAGRMTSAYIPALGIFDGASIVGRIGKLSAGVAGGGDPSDLSLSGASGTSKGAVFLNYQAGEDFMHRYDGTVAYARLIRSGTSEREFLYMQNNLTLGTEWSVYQNAELDLKELLNGLPEPRLSVSNAMLMVNCRPNDWLMINVSYDAVHPVTLLQSMRTLADSLLIRGVDHRLRGDFTTRLTRNVTFTASAGVTGGGGDLSPAYLYGGSVRITDFLDWHVNGYLRYQYMAGPFASVDNVVLGLDRFFRPSWTVDLRGSCNRARLPYAGRSFTTYRGTGSVYCTIFEKYFTAISLDGILDETMNSAEVSYQVGIRL